MTNQEIEAKAQELYPSPDESIRKLYSFRAAFKQQEDLRFAVLQGYNLRQPEIDQLKERVKELEEGLKTFSENFSLYMPKRGMTNDIYITAVWHSHNTAKQLLTKKQ
jgi:hypothetical protein